MERPLSYMETTQNPQASLNNDSSIPLNEICKRRIYAMVKNTEKYKNLQEQILSTIWNTDIAQIVEEIPLKDVVLYRSEEDDGVVARFHKESEWRLIAYCLTEFEELPVQLEVDISTHKCVMRLANPNKLPWTSAKFEVDPTKAYLNPTGFHLIIHIAREMHPLMNVATLFDKQPYVRSALNEMSDKIVSTKGIMNPIAECEFASKFLFHPKKKMVTKEESEEVDEGESLIPPALDD